MKRKLSVVALYTLTIVGLALASAMAHINGATAEFGSGAVDLDADGITLATGTNDWNRIKLTNGSWLGSQNGGGGWRMSSNSTLQLDSSSSTFWFDAALYGTSTPNLGTTSFRWGNFYAAGAADIDGNVDVDGDIILENNFYIDGDIIWNAPPTTTADDYPLVYSTGTNQVYRKTDGYTGTCSSPSSIVIERGIVTGCS